jgi:hypothetical protein
MRFLIAAIALLVIGTIFGSIAALVLGWSSLKLAQRELRYEGAGAVAIIPTPSTGRQVDATLRYSATPPIPNRYRSPYRPGFDPLRLVGPESGIS